MPWFRKKKGKIEPVRDEERVVRTENVFVRCDECSAHLYKKELEDALQVCAHCNYHFRIGAYDRLEKLFDDAYCEELDAEVVSTDPLEFVDSKPYPKRIAQAQRATGLPEAIITARGKVGGHRVFAGAMDMLFIGGSMGSAVGEKVTRLIERVIEQTIRQKLPKDFQRSEFLLAHGMIDEIVDRREIRPFIIKALDFMMNPDITSKSTAQATGLKFEVEAPTP